MLELLERGVSQQGILELEAGHRANVQTTTSLSTLIDLGGVLVVMHLDAALGRSRRGTVDAAVASPTPCTFPALRSACACTISAVAKSFPRLCRVRWTQAG